MGGSSALQGLAHCCCCLVRSLLFLDDSPFEWLFRPASYASITVPEAMSYHFEHFLRDDETLPRFAGTSERKLIDIFAILRKKMGFDDGITIFNFLFFIQKFLWQIGWKKKQFCGNGYLIRGNFLFCHCYWRLKMFHGIQKNFSNYR